MNEPPDVDGRRREAIREDVETITPYYTESWNPESEGPGTALLALFAEMVEDVVERLDRVPEKHRAAFFDTLGFSRRPPQPAQIPLSFQIADGADQNVVVDDGTQAVAPAIDSRPEQTFGIAADSRFEATPANLASIYSVDPAHDGIYDHWDPPEEGGLSEGGEQFLFMGKNQQKHALYVGHVNQLNVTSDSESGAGTATVRLKLESETSWEVLRDDLEWEYHGERKVGKETKEGWHTFDRQAVGWETLNGRQAWISRASRSRIPPTVGPDNSAQDEVVFDLELNGALTETTVNGVESRWIRATIPQYADIEDFSDLQIGTSIRVGPGPSVEQDETDGDEGDGDGNGGDGDDDGGSPKTMTPDQLLYNDVPLPFGTLDSEDGDEDGENEGGDGEATPPFYPLGTAPQVQDTFYIASSEAFTKSDAGVQFSFEDLKISPSSTGDSVSESSDGDGNDQQPEAIVKNNLPRLSWEYWDGEAWSRIDGLEDKTNALIGKQLNDEEPAENDTVTFPVPDDLAKTTVAGHENRWIRGRLVGGNYGKRIAKENSGEWETKHIVHPPMFEDLLVSYVSSKGSKADDSENGGSSNEDGGDGTAAALPLEPATHLITENNLAYSDNLAEEERQQVRPFEPPPDDEQTLYLGFDGRLHDGPITLFFEITDRAYPPDFHSRVRWEYCADPADDEWVRLDVQDGTEGLTERGIVSLVFPGETARCPRFGTEPHWIRARVTGDSFEPLVFRVPFDPGVIDPGLFDPGRFRPEPSDPGRFDFGELDAPFITDPGWTQPVLKTDWVTSGTPSTDETALMNEIAGMAGSAMPEETTGTVDATVASESRAVLLRPFDPVKVGDALDVGEYVFTPRLPTFPHVPIIPDWIGPWLPFLPKEEEDEESEPVESCGRTLQTEPPSGDPTRLPPTVSGLSPNTGWAYNVRTVENETLGSSDGSQSQTFVAAAPPVVDEAVWVDELNALSEGKRRELREAETPAIETTTDGDGSLQAFWVEWTGVSDLLDSDEDDRHYTVDRTAGEITFGNGIRGRIPPRGQDSVRISYRTGGGPDGNVDVGAVAELKSSLQFVDSVTNPAPGTGGASAESTDRVVSRAPKQLRDRDRAVTEVDYERIAMNAARRLARVKCIPDMNRAGESEPGWVTLLIVPNDPRPKPFPSAGLKEQVWKAVSDRAPATVVAADRLVVRGPSYVEVTVETDLVAEGRGSVATLEEVVTGEIQAFLHPLSGSEEGEGWAFGELPAMSDLYALIEGVDGVDHVTELSIRFGTSEGVATIREGEEPPSVSEDALIYNGVHEVTVGLGAPRAVTELEGV
jgi:hypothetical protein